MQQQKQLKPRLVLRMFTTNRKGIHFAAPVGLTKDDRDNCVMCRINRGQHLIAIGRECGKAISSNKH